MKRFLGLVLALSFILAWSNDSFAIRITDFTAATSASDTDLLWMTLNPGTTPVDRKITRADFLTGVLTFDTNDDGVADITFNADGTISVGSTASKVVGGTTAEYIDFGTDGKIGLYGAGGTYNNSLLIELENATNMVDISATNEIIRINSSVGQYWWKNSSNASSIAWGLNGTLAQFIFGVRSGIGRQLVLADYDTGYTSGTPGSYKDFDHASQTNPTLYVQSVTSPDDSNSEYVSLTHDKTNTILNTGYGGIVLGTDAQPARGTITFTALPTAAQTMVLNATTITAVASGATTDQFNIGATAAATATNLIATINAGTESINAHAYSGGSGIVIVEWLTKGTAGNTIVLTEGLDNCTADGSGTLADTGVAAGIAFNTTRGLTCEAYGAIYHVGETDTGITTLSNNRVDVKANSHGWSIRGDTTLPHSVHTGNLQDVLQAVTVSAGAGKAALTLSPTETYIEITNEDADGCDVTMSESNIEAGYYITIVNAGTNSLDFADTDGVQNLSAAFTMDADDVLMLRYKTGEWVEVSRSAN